MFTQSAPKKEDTTIPRYEIARIFRLNRNRGAAAELARRTNTSTSSISLWLKGSFKSERIHREASILARELEPPEKGEQS